MKPFNAKLDIWHYMAYTIAHELNISPRTILDEWGCSDLLVTFGVYMNDKMASKYADYKALSSKAKNKIPKDERPTEYAIRFVTYDQLYEMQKPKTEDQKKQLELEQAKIEAFMKGGGLIG